MVIPSLLFSKLDAPGIITALRGNGRTIVTAAFQLLLLRDQVRDALERRGKGAAAYHRAALESLDSDLAMIGAGMVIGKDKLQHRVKRAYDLARKL